MGIRILIVDDSSLMRHIIKKVIQQTQIQVDAVLEAGDGQEALDVIAREPVDLVLSDINMPRMDGIQMLMQLRQMESTQNLPRDRGDNRGHRRHYRAGNGIGRDGLRHQAFHS